MKKIAIILTICAVGLTGFYVGLYKGIADAGGAVSSVEVMEGESLPYTIYINEDGSATIEVERSGYIRQNPENLKLMVMGVR